MNITLLEATILEIPLDAVHAVIDTLEQHSPDQLEPEELELLEAMRTIRPLLIEIHHAKTLTNGEAQSA